MEANLYERMAGPSNTDPGIDYWDRDIEDHEYWTPAFDSDRHLPGRQRHAYPDSIVLSLLNERDRLIAQRTFLRRDLARLQYQLDLAREDLEEYKWRNRLDRKRNHAGQKLIFKAWKLLDQEEDPEEFAPHSEEPLIQRPRREDASEEDPAEDTDPSVGPA